MKNLFLLCCLCFSLIGYTQNLSAPESYKEKKETLKTALRQLNGLEAKMKFLDSIIIVEKEKEYPFENYLAEVYHHYGGLYYNSYQTEEAIEKYLLALPLRRNKTAFNYYDLARTNYMIGTCHFENGKYEKSLAYLKLAEQAYQNSEEIESSDTNLEFKTLQASMEYLKKASDDFEELKRWKKVFKTKVYLARAYTRLGDYGKAKKLFLDGIEYQQKVLEEDEKNLAKYYNYFGGMFLDNNELKEAKKYYQKALNIYQKNSLKKNEANTLNNIGLIYLKERKTKEAIKYLKEAVAIRKQLDGEIQLSVAKIYENIGIAYKLEQKYSEAFTWINQALTIRQQLIKTNRKHLDFNKSYHNLGALHLAQNNYDKALYYLQKAIQQQVINFQLDDFFANPSVENVKIKEKITSNFASFSINPSVEDVKTILGSPEDLLEDLQYKATALKEWYYHSGEEKYLKAAKETLRLATQVAESMRTGFLAADTKLSWLEKTFPVFENAIATNWELYQLQASEELFTEILTLMEQNKAVLLLKDLKIEQVIHKIGIPDSTRLSYKNLYKEKEEQVNQLTSIIGTPEENDQRVQIENEVEEIELRIATFEEKLRNDFPEFKKLTDNNYAGIEKKLSKILLPNQAFLEYFVGDSIIYVAAMTKEKLSINTVSKKSVQDGIKQLLPVIKNPPTRNTKSNHGFKVFTKTAHQLYNLLLKDLLEDLAPSIDHLLIVPDGITATIPFSVLLQESANTTTVNYNQDQLKYLLNDYSINYAYSGTHLISADIFLESPNGNLSFLGYAPQFEERNQSNSLSTNYNLQLPQLKYNQNEVKDIQAIMGGDIMVDSDATKHSFLELAPEYSILHLATHAYANSEYTNHNCIYFAGDSALYSNEVAFLKLQADMIVLSACETGIGKFKKGEGTMSLARNFAATGIPSTTMSLWSVNDASTKELMTYYYQFLNEGQGKDQALRNAKLKFSKNQEDLYKLHPYYWAGFVHYGVATPIVQESSSNWSWGVPLLLFLVGGFFYFRR